MRSQRLIAAAVVIALSGALAGCSSSISNWDPTDLLDFLDTKKKLPGERKPLFPEGVPGLEQGVPKDLYKGAQEQQQQDALVAPPPAAPPPAAPPPRRGAEIQTRCEIEGQGQAGARQHQARGASRRGGRRSRRGPAGS